MSTQNGVLFGVGAVRIFSGRETVEDLLDIVENVYPEMEGQIAQTGMEPVCELRLIGPVVDELLAEKGEEFEATPALEALRELLAERKMFAVSITGGPLKGGLSREQLIARNGLPWTDEGKFASMRKGLHLLPHLHNGSVPYVFAQSLAGIMRRDIEGREAELNPIIARNIARVAAELYRLSEASEKGLVLGLDPTRGQSLMYANEVVDFWEDYLLTVGAEALRESLGVGAEKGEEILRTHVMIREDAGHARMCFADPVEHVRLYRQNGIGVCAINLGNSPRLEAPSENPGLEDFIAHYSDGAPILVQVQGRKAGWRGFVTEHLSDLREKPGLVDGLEELAIHDHLRLDQAQDPKFGFSHVQAEAMADFCGLCRFYRDQDIPMPPVYSHVIDYRDEQGERISNSDREPLYEAILGQALFASEQLQEQVAVG
ncbi:MAG: hypothetical protein O7G87_11205 [bacterium]|nr:hypothetical protein [bacterium]